jgi:CP family cyanate transporter-like MFS transporter
MTRSSRSTAAALLVVGLNLRLAISAVPPVLNQIRHGTGLSSAGGGLLTALPIFCFGLVALATPALIRRFGMGPVLAFTMVTVAAGSALRLVPSVVALFVGTAVIGAGIALGNVLVPGILKRDFSARIALMMALYTLVLCISGALPAGLTVPLEHATGFGWRPAIAIWGLAAVVATALWFPHARRDRPSRENTDASLANALRRDRLAWCVTLFMGMQSFGFYASFNWVPTLLENHGTANGTAGWLLSFSTFPSMLAAFSTPALIRRVSPATLVVLAGALCGGAYAGLLAAPVAAGSYPWMTLMGLGQGALLSLALSFIVARARDSHQAAQLSTMAQSIGYLLASSGPFIVGALHGATGGWTLPMLVLLASLVPLTACGLIASQDRYVLAVPAPV